MKVKFLWVVLIIINLAACKQTQFSKHTITGEALGTFFTIHYYINNNNLSDTNKIDFQIDSILTEFNKTASIYDTNSLISKINKNQTDSLNDILKEILIIAQRISKESNGAFDVTVGPLVNAWGFGNTERVSLNQQKIDSIKEFVGYEKIEITNNRIVKKDSRIQINLNAIAKGYVVDLLAQTLEKNNIKSYIVEVGGEIRAGNRKPNGELWNVAIEKPSENAASPQQEFQRIYIENKAIATSGTYRNYFEENGKRYSHTIDPKSGYPIKNKIVSATIITPQSCAEADAWATACMVLDVENSLNIINKQNDIDAFFIYDDGGKLNTKFNSGFKQYFTTKN